MGKPKIFTARLASALSTPAAGYEAGSIYYTTVGGRDVYCFNPWRVIAARTTARESTGMYTMIVFYHARLAQFNGMPNSTTHATV